MCKQLVTSVCFVGCFVDERRVISHRETCQIF